MFKKTKRKGFNFFRSYYDVYNELADKDKVAFMDALLDREFLGIKPEGLTGMAKFAYISQTNSIDSQVKGYEDKTKTKLLPTPYVGGTQGGINPPTLQVQEKEKEKEKEKLQYSMADFKKSLQPFLEIYGKDMLNEFYLYWTEHNDKGKKLRFQYAKNQPFYIQRRLVTWSNRQQNFKEKKVAPKKETAAQALRKKYGISNI